MTTVAEPTPLVPLDHLDHLWFQVAGTLCNYTCLHCFISCSPKNDSFRFLSHHEVERRLIESQSLGVKEYYFTGGEPFLNPDLVDILCTTLNYGAATVLTNASVLKGDWLTRLAQAEAESRYSLEFRVSLDGFSSATNDPIRGSGTFERTMRGVEHLVKAGFLPIITAARTWDEQEEARVIGQFHELLRGIGYERPRVKVLPTLRLGAEAIRTCGYTDQERVTPDMMRGFDMQSLVCHHSRIVTDRGVHVCPILIDSPDSLLAQDLAGSQVPFAIGHGACLTCFQYGAICSNPSSTATPASSTRTAAVDKTATAKPS